MRATQKIIGKSKVIMEVSEEPELLKFCKLIQPDVKNGDIIADYDGDICFFRILEGNILINISFPYINKERNYILNGGYVFIMPKKPLIVNVIEIQNHEQLLIAKYIHKTAKIGCYIIKYDNHHSCIISFEEFMEKFTTLPKKLRQQKRIPPTV